MDELRSHLVLPEAKLLPSSTPPCQAPDGYHWVHAYPPQHIAPNRFRVGKWLIRVTCQQVDYCWGVVRQATQEGSLGIGAKVSTDWGNSNDPAEPGGWNGHVICVYTSNLEDKQDVLRVARRLQEIDAIRTQQISYKPDVLTYAGYYAHNAPGEVAIYLARPPYDTLIEQEKALEFTRRSMAIVDPEEAVGMNAERNGKRSRIPSGLLS